MMKKFSLILTVAVLALSIGTAFGDYVVRITLPQGRAVADLAQCPGVTLWGYFSSGLIAKVTADKLPTLDGQGYRPEVLDEVKSDGVYYIAWDAGYPEGQTILASWSKILCSENGTYLIWVSDPSGFVMNKGPLMLNRIGHRPLIVSQDEAGGSSSAFAVNPYVQAMVNAVRVDSSMAALRRLQNYRNRYSTSDSCRAAVNWTANKYRAYRARIPQDTVTIFNWSGTYAPDVYMERPGYVHPETIAVIGGHIDDMSNPGADDNGTGTVAAIEAARVMKGYDFELTARFCAFTGEEQGLLGSDTLASYFYRRGDRIVGMLNYDMIGHVDIAPESLDIHGRTGTSDDWLMNFAKAAADTYTTMPVVLIKSNLSGSDHASFWAQGWTATCQIEDYPLHNPAYHTQADSIGTGPNVGVNDTLWFVNAVRASVAAFALLCRPFRTNTVADAGTSSVLPGALTLWPVIPNPSTGRSLIRYVLPRSANTALETYDLGGRLVKKICTGYARAGEHQVYWDGRSELGEPLPNGIYFLKLQAGSETRTLPVVLVR
jgi:hypothetical protein